MTSVAGSKKSPKTICFHGQHIDYICHWDCLLTIDFNPFKFPSCIDSACIFVLVFRQSSHVIVDTDKRQRLYLLEVAA